MKIKILGPNWVHPNGTSFAGRTDYISIENGVDLRVDADAIVDMTSDGIMIFRPLFSEVEYLLAAERLGRHHEWRERWCGCFL